MAPHADSDTLHNSCGSWETRRRIVNEIVEAHRSDAQMLANGMISNYEGISLSMPIRARTEKLEEIFFLRRL